MSSLNEHFQKVEKALAILLDEMSDTLSWDERESVARFIDVCEYGIALETLNAIIIEEEKTVSPEIYMQILASAELMKIRESIDTSELAARVVDLP